jgi:hypothetical protein
MIIQGNVLRVILGQDIPFVYPTWFYYFILQHILNHYKQFEVKLYMFLKKNSW